jgi:hypothetical protein
MPAGKIVLLAAANHYRESSLDATSTNVLWHFLQITRACYRCARRDVSRITVAA